MNINAFIWILISTNLMFVLVLVIAKWKSILSFLYPDKYAYVTMLQLDDSVSEYLVKKGNQLKFEFNDGLYNMFPAKYRFKRLAQFFYKEGTKEPLDFRNMKYSGNAELDKQVMKINVARLVTREKPMLEELLQKYGIYILGGMFILIAIIVYGGK